MNYSKYLKLDKLLTLQHQLSSEPNHDEMLFIVTHQATELWFKLLLHELDYLGRLFVEKNQPKLLETIHRSLIILKHQVMQFDILDTLKPIEFLAIRNALGSSSGFQSFQFRELEFFLGNKNKDKIRSLSSDKVIYDRLFKRYSEPTLWDYFLIYLSKYGYSIPSEILNRDVTKLIEPSEVMQNTLREIYYHHPEITQICESLINLDSILQQWRYRHLQIVSRIIGGRPGTGGTTGMNYLFQTIAIPAFPDLWALRSHL